MKKIIFLILLGFFGFISFGCSTVKGTAEGLAYGTKSVANGVASDVVAVGAGIIYTDEWIKEHVW